MACTRIARGGPRGSLGGATYEARMASVKAQVAAGATRIVAMPVFDAGEACAWALSSSSPLVSPPLPLAASSTRELEPSL